jgi:Zn-dependent protease
MGKLIAWLLVAGKMGKLLTTGGTMLISMFVYSFVFGWRYAVGFVLLIFVHEMGHYLAARQKGLNVGVPTFIPFVGAWIELKDLPHDVETEAYVGFAGPIVGTAGAIACYWAARAYDSQLMLALAYSGCMLNLFNLIPISPLDGGRITAIISPKAWLFGVPLLTALFFYRPSPMLILIAVLAYPQIKLALKKDGGASEKPAGYYEVSTETRVNYAVFYLGLAGFLAVMSYELHSMLGEG